MELHLEPSALPTLAEPTELGHPAAVAGGLTGIHVDSATINSYSRSCRGWCTLVAPGSAHWLGAHLKAYGASSRVVFGSEVVVNSQGITAVLRVDRPEKSQHTAANSSR